MNDHRPANIVMIEDDGGHARLIQKNIRRAGISNTIHHFMDGSGALAFLLEGAAGPVRNGPALVPRDLGLPDMSGTDIPTRIKGNPALLRPGLHHLHHQADELREFCGRDPPRRPRSVSPDQRKARSRWRPSRSHAPPMSPSRWA